MRDVREIKDAAWAAYCEAPTRRDMGRSAVDAAVDAVLAVLSARAAVTEVGKLAPVAFAGSDGKPAWIHDGKGVGVSTAVPFKTVLYALSLPDGVLVRNGPLGVLATDDEAQAMRLAHVRDADGPPTIVRYLYAGTWSDWNSAGRKSPAEQAAVPEGWDIRHTEYDGIRVESPDGSWLNMPSTTPQMYGADKLDRRLLFALADALLAETPKACAGKGSAA